MKIIIDNNIPFIKGILENYADVSYLPGNEINPAIVKDADALLIRTRTKCGPDLLTGSRVRFIGTATIGTDHIDTAWCENNGIKWVNAPGCNSGSVMQYITSALLWLSGKYGFNLREKTLGIVGVGNVGIKVHRMALAMGMNVLLNDPPRERAEGKSQFVSFEELAAESDIISFHVPLTLSGSDKTLGLAGSGFFTNSRKGHFIINSSRGGVVDESFLIRSLKSGFTTGAVTDVWAGEPGLDIDLMKLSAISTPHIAGYSLDGKWNASVMVLEQLSEFFGLGLSQEPIAGPQVPADSMIFLNAGDPLDIQLRKAVNTTYDIVADSEKLKNSPLDFEKIRNNYPARREFHAYNTDAAGEASVILGNLGFR